MLFQFNLTTQSLKIKAGEYWLVLPEEWKFTNFHGVRFILDSNDYDHWINFTLAQEKICCFYKVSSAEGFNYYRRKISRPLSGTIEFEFTEYDRIEKKRGGWVKVNC